jgi:hypothetical protein
LTSAAATVSPDMSHRRALRCETHA